MVSTAPTAPATPRVTVSADDIARGAPGSCLRCPIALALRRAFPDAECVEVDSWRAWIDGVRYWLPQSAQLVIQCVDRGLDVIPFSFELVAA